MTDHHWLLVLVPIWIVALVSPRHQGKAAALNRAVAAARGERPSSTVLEPTLALRSSTAPPPRV